MGNIFDVNMIAGSYGVMPDAVLPGGRINGKGAGLGSIEACPFHLVLPDYLCDDLLHLHCSHLHHILDDTAKGTRQQFRIHA